ncbi:MAG: hypothetical protein HYY87_03405, partial [Candidatus Levybacteria bacterium]|nr:hypothetical protein [Candidatus Levybacteria bacterium]
TVTAQQSATETSLSTIKEVLPSLGAPEKIPFQIEYSPKVWVAGSWGIGGLRLSSIERLPLTEDPANKGVSAAIVDVITNKLSSPMTIDEYANYQKASLKNNNLQYTQEKRKIDEYEAIIFTYHGPFLKTSTTFHRRALLIDKSQRVWEFSLFLGSPKPDREARFIPAFDEILGSFKIIDTPTTRPAEAPKPSPSPDSRTETGWTRFKSLDLPYQLDYPSNWRQAGNRFYGETTKANPTLFQVTSTPIPDWITLDDFKDQTIKQFIDTVKVLGAGIDLKQTPNQTIGGQKAWRLDSTVSSSQTTPNVSVIYLTTKDGKAWAVQFAADASVFNQELPKFQKMVASFKFLK